MFISFWPFFSGNAFFSLGSISPTFSEQLLRVKIPFAQKDIDSLFALWGSSRVKALCTHAAFSCADPKSVKKTDNLTVFFCTFRICKRKSCSRNVDEIAPWSPRGLCFLAKQNNYKFCVFHQNTRCIVRLLGCFSPPFTFLRLIVLKHCFRTF